MNDRRCPAEMSGEEADPEWLGEMRALYDEVDGEVARLGPICELSGRCCRFAEFGHTLFVSTAEVQYMLGAAPRPERPLDRGASCPWQDPLGRCSAREGRPLGCRVYYCDPSYQSAAFDLSERFIARLRHLTENHRLPWNYAPLHQHLFEARARGRLAIDLADHDNQGSPI